MTTQDWIGILWLAAITILYAYAYHKRTQHTKHKEHKENSRQIVSDFIKAEKHKKEQQELAQPAHIRLQNAINQARYRQLAATQYQDQTEINEINTQP